MRLLPNWLKSFIDFTSDSEAPNDFHFWVGVSTIAGALRRRVWIDQRKFQWTPNFYIVLVGPPGIASKSTSIRTGIHLLEKVPNVHFGPASMTWQALVDSLSDAVEHVKTINPVTGGDMFLPMSCLTIAISELGTFLKLEDPSLSDVLVELWDGQETMFAHKTRTNGATEVKNPWLNIIGCTTPAWLKANFPDHLIGGGLTSRIVFVYGDKKRFLVPYPDELIQGKTYYDLQAALLHDLIEISKMTGPYAMTPEARQWGKDWYAKHWSVVPSHMASERYQGYIARKQTHLHKLAIICAASRSSVMQITHEHMIEAESILNSTEPHMARVFESVGMVDEARRGGEIASYVKRVGWVSDAELWRLVQNVMNQKEYKEALSAAIKGGSLSVERRNGVLGVVSGNTHPSL